MTFKNSIVYLVDDDTGLTEAIRFILQNAGLTIQTFASAEAFLEFLPENLDQYLSAKPSPIRCCALVDVHLPGIDGLHLQEILCERGILVPIVFLTGYGNIESSVRAIKAGAENFLLKPVTMDKLLAAIDEALTKSDTWLAQENRTHEAKLRLRELTPREFEVLSLAVRGLSNKLIGQRLDISTRTVEHHKSSIISKTGASTLLELAKIVEESNVDKRL
jgi:two-component system response regulator FixJ